MPEHGIIATLALVGWVPLSVLLFTTMRTERAAAVVLIGGIMFLPELAEFDFPGVPPLGKQGVAVLCVLGGAIYKRPGWFMRSRPFRGVEALVLVLLVCGIGTVMANRDPLVYGSWHKIHLPPLANRDVLSLAIRDLLQIGLPFYLGRVLFRTAKDLRDLIAVLAGAGLLYSLFIIVELRLSPQWHNWIYGYGQHRDFFQTQRWGGWRPMVFMAHGLAVGLFAVVVTIAMSVLAHLKQGVGRIPARLAAPYLFLLMVLCKSTGAIIYGLLAVPMIALTTTKTQLRICVVLSAVVLGYPMLRASGWFPTDAFVSMASRINPERADSLAFRFEMEDALSEKAAERLWFGWGGFGRNGIYDSEMGKEISVADGYWIIQLGNRGLTGFFPAFLLLLYPVFYTQRRLHLIRSKKERILLAGLAVIVTLYVIDLIPNGLFSNLPFFLSGALYGLATRMRGARRPPAQNLAATKQAAVTAPVA